MWWEKETGERTRCPHQPLMYSNHFHVAINRVPYGIYHPLCCLLASQRPLSSSFLNSLISLHLISLPQIPPRPLNPRAPGSRPTEPAPFPQQHPKKCTKEKSFLGHSPFVGKQRILSSESRSSAAGFSVRLCLSTC